MCERYIYWYLFYHLCNLTTSFDLPLTVPKFTLHTRNSTNLLSRWCSCLVTVSIGIYLTLFLACVAFSLFFKIYKPFYAVWFINTLYDLINSKCDKVSWPVTLPNVNPMWWCSPVFMSKHHLYVLTNQGWRLTRVTMRWKLYPTTHQAGNLRSVQGQSAW